jgi:ketosteroid isomerase-like protein
MMAETQITEKVVLEYFEASNTKNEAKLLNCFSEDAVVVDEGKTYSGMDAIRVWRNKVNALYNVRFEIEKQTSNSEGIVVDVKCSGNFPGSPLIIKHNFVMMDEKICYLKIV